MNRLLFICALLGLSIIASGQKSRVLSVFQMIESEKYEEAREAIDMAVLNHKTSKWNRTYYAKGLLCQKAFEAGFEKNDSKKTNLYPDQLVVAYNAYEKALQLNASNRISSAITMQYYALANDFQKLGEKHFLKKEYYKAMEAFEHALLVTKSPLISVETDTNLVYNTAIAAYEASNWDKAISYLTGLNDDGYSSNSALLLYRAHLNNGDSQRGEEVLKGGLERYNWDELLVLQLVDLLVSTNKQEEAVDILDTALVRRPENYHFPWTRGLVYQQMELYNKAIASLSIANTIAPGEVGICYNLGICYYNIGVDINDASRNIRDITEYQAARKQGMVQFQEAIKWLEKAHDLEPGDQQTIAKLYQLYYRLHLTDKQKSMELLLH